MVTMIIEWFCRLRDSCRRANISSRDHGATQDICCTGNVYPMIQNGSGNVTRSYEVVSLDCFGVEHDSGTVYIGSDEEDAVVDSPNGPSQVNEPPSYFDLVNEPPPAYTEAVGRESDGNAQHVTIFYVTPKERNQSSENQ